MDIPLHFVGADKAPGVKEGGVFSRNVVEVEVECLPKDIPEYLEVDVSGLEIGDVRHLSDIVLPEGVEITALAHDEEHEHDMTIAAVHHPRITEEEEPEEEETEAEAAEAEGEEDADKEEADEKKSGKESSSDKQESAG